MNQSNISSIQLAFRATINLSKDDLQAMARLLCRSLEKACMERTPFAQDMPLSVRREILKALYERAMDDDSLWSY